MSEDAVVRLEGGSDFCAQLAKCVIETFSSCFEMSSGLKTAASTYMLFAGCCSDVTTSTDTHRDAQYRRRAQLM